MEIERIAEVAHEVNRAYCLALGDHSQLPWSVAPAWQRDSALNGVRAIAEGTVTGPGESHKNWLREKLAAGWRYGPIKDANRKEHPCMVSFNELPAAERAKDHIFYALVKALLAVG